MTTLSIMAISKMMLHKMILRIITISIYFTSVIFECSQQARMFVPGWPFQPSLVFAGNTSGRIQSYSQTLNEAGKAWKGQTLQFFSFVKYGSKKFYNIGP